MNNAPRTASGATVWLTGLPSAGKSTIADALADRLRDGGHRVEVLDGDEMRTFLTRGLGFSRADRIENVRRIGWIAALLARNGVKALVPVIAPFASARDKVREMHAASGAPYLEVHVATPLAECRRRDVKGLYAKQARGELSGLTGVDDPYEPPNSPELRIDTDRLSIESAVTMVHSALSARGLV
jgi:adenylylsulfate kinase